MGALTVTPSTPALVLFGRDQAGKPHASWFDAASVELATKAAELMSMRAVPVETDALREVVAGLPRGRLFSSGRAFTPFVKGKLYERLVEVTRDAPSSEPDANIEVQAEAEAAPSDGPGATPTDNQATRTETAVEPSAEGAAPIAAVPEAAKLAAAPATPPVTTAAAKPKPSPRPSRVEEVAPGSTVLATTGAAEGWYEARVIGTNGSTFTLKWVDYGEPSFVRRGNELGFLPRLPD